MTPPRIEAPHRPPAADRSPPRLLLYRMVQLVAGLVFIITGGLRATGRRNVPPRGAALLVSNHLSHFDVIALGILLDRPLNFVARSTLFVAGVGPFIRALGAFPIKREGMGAEGLKETLRRLKAGGIVTLFPEGTRSADGELAELKSGIAVLATRAKVPIIPAAVAGTFEAWPRWRPWPRAHPIRVHYGAPIDQADLAGLSPEAVTTLIRDRLLACQATARRGLARDLRGNCDWPGGPI